MVRLAWEGLGLLGFAMGLVGSPGWADEQEQEQQVSVRSAAPSSAAPSAERFSQVRAEMLLCVTRYALRESSRLALVDLLRLDVRADYLQLSERWQNRPPSFQAGRVQLKLGLPATLVEPTRARTP